MFRIDPICILQLKPYFILVYKTFSYRRLFIADAQKVLMVNRKSPFRYAPNQPTASRVRLTPPSAV